MICAMCGLKATVTASLKFGTVHARWGVSPTTLVHPNCWPEYAPSSAAPQDEWLSGKQLPADWEWAPRAA